MMSEEYQTTIAGPVSFTGIGLHSAEKVCAVLHPASDDHGVLFIRTDLAGDADNSIHASPEAVSKVQLGTTLENDAGISVSTVEHLMGALAICNIDNVMVEIDAAEMPIMDGSAAPFVEEIRSIGLVQQSNYRGKLEISLPIEERDGDRFIRIEPSDARTLHVTIEFSDELIGLQSVELDLVDTIAIAKRVAPARTFCRLADIEAMRSAGLSRGGSLDNAIVVDNARMLNETGLRDPQEFALHKALDLIGDLHLLGSPIYGNIIAFKPGHDLNVKMARRLAGIFTS